MTSRIEDHCWITGIRWRALIGAVAVGTVLLSAVTATQSQQALSDPKNGVRTTRLWVC
jgi:hypothetical protein